jgi:hypothetical protein
MSVELTQARAAPRLAYGQPSACPSQICDEGRSAVRGNRVPGSAHRLPGYLQRFGGRLPGQKRGLGASAGFGRTRPTGQTPWNPWRPPPVWRVILFRQGPEFRVPGRRQARPGVDLAPSISGSGTGLWLTGGVGFGGSFSLFMASGERWCVEWLEKYNHAQPAASTPAAWLVKRPRTSRPVCY